MRDFSKEQRTEIMPVSETFLGILSIETLGNRPRKCSLFLKMEGEEAGIGGSEKLEVALQYRAQGYRIIASPPLKW